MRGTSSKALQQFWFNVLPVTVNDSYAPHQRK